MPSIAMATHNFGMIDSCKRDCVECWMQFKTATLPGLDERDDGELVMKLSDDNAREIAKNFASEAEADRLYIQTKLAECGDAIRSRWKKKSKDKRELMLLEAEPELYRYNSGVSRIDGCDPEAVEEATHLIARVRNSQLLPDLNTETLKEDPMRLLSLLHHRSTSKLEDWVLFDAAQMTESVEHGVLSRQYNECCVVMYGSRYGDLVSWTASECHRWDIVGYPRAVLVLEAQSVLMGFLRKMVDIIVPQEPSGGSSGWRALTAAGFKASGEVEHWSSFSNQAFSAPPVFDPETALRRARAQLAAAEDHLTSLQTDPAYLHSLLAKQRRGDHFPGLTSEKMWQYLVCGAVLSQITHVGALRDLVDECARVVHSYESFKDRFKRGTSLPEGYERALNALGLLCLNNHHKERLRLADLIPLAPGFRRNHRYVTTADGELMIKLHNIENCSDPMDIPESLFRLEPLLSGLYMLSERHDEIESPYLMGFIDDHLAHATDKERARIDQTPYDHLSRMTVYREIWATMRMTRPLVSLSAFNYEKATEEEKRRRTWRRYGRSPRELTSVQRKMLSKLLSVLYATPMPAGKKGEMWLDKAKEARKRLAEFWAYVRQVRRRQIADSGLTVADIEEEVAILAADQTEEYIAEVKAEVGMVERTIAAYRAATQDDGSAEVQTMWGDAGSQKIELPIGRVKPKTRAATGVAEAVDIAEDDTLVEPPPGRIAVNAESLRIFARMFPMSAEVALKGVVRWQQFVTAMADAGCSATHTGGSAVSFDVKASTGKGGTIVFHKPHPDPEVDAVKLQSMGKRLRKWFGWDGDVFVEREKEKK
ncbi:hypothetical protein LTR85_003346 [Meristemomyces frigidus]|nr:hypothetical protein LTR85_003346 [Meristemomyces frigidus]